MRKTLFLGAGGSTKKMIKAPFLEALEEEEEILTLDIRAPADIIFDLNQLHYPVGPPPNPELPFEDESLTEIHAYEVLEHYGRQGDWVGFFQEWGEFHRVLKMGGCFFGTVPEAHQTWGDPGHCRALNSVTLSFLNHAAVEAEVKKEKNPRTPSPDWGGNFVKIFDTHSNEPGRYGFTLQKQPRIDYTSLHDKVQ